MPAPGANIVLYTLYECRKAYDANIGIGFGVRDIPIAARLPGPVLTHSLPSRYETETQVYRTFGG